MPSHEDYKELLIPHALDALERAEARSLEEHLEDCAECRTELDSWRATTATLAFAAQTAEPSAQLRTRILDKARALGQPEANTQAKVKREAVETVTNHTNSQSSNVIEMPARRAWSSPQIFGAIAASLLIAALAVSSIVLWQRNKAMEAETARLSRQIKEQEQELAKAKEDKSMLTAPGSNMAMLGGTEMAKDARARIAYDRQTGRAMLIADGLPPAPAGKAYQLWFIVEGKPPMPGGVFNTDANGHAEMRDQMPSEGRNAGVFAVTLERAGGVPAPEGKAYLQGKAS